MTRPSNFTVTALLLLLVLTAQVTRAQEREPILRIETGTHIDSIYQVSVDAANRYLVTAGSDKTIRVWELPEIRLLRTIRPMLGKGNLGTILNAAISPDGQTIAANILTETDEKNFESSIYIYSRESGRVIYRLPQPASASVSRLAYSKDGRYMVVTLVDRQLYIDLIADASGDKNVRYGLYIYDTSTYKIVTEDKAAKVIGVDFDPSGRLLTSSVDGSVQLYGRIEKDAPLHLITQVKFPNAVFWAEFSPDGSKVAVAFQSPGLANTQPKQPQINVLSGYDLQLLYSADSTGMGTRGAFLPPQIAWSSDGLILYAFTLLSKPYHPFGIRLWANAGKGPYIDTLINSPVHFVTLRDGRLLFGNNEGVIGSIDPSGTIKPLISPATIDFGYEGNLLVSPDGTTVEVNYGKTGQQPVQFSINSRALDKPFMATDLRPPNKDGSKFNFDLVVEGSKLVLKKSQNGLGGLFSDFAVSPDGQRLLVDGTLYDRNGTELWKISLSLTESVAIHVNITENGKFVVAALHNGTIHWYRLSDGKELLTLFPHPDQKRWVLWTPSGYYDASPGAEDLIGWHVNNGRDAAADFFPVGQFRATYYRPDVIAKILTTGDEQLALKQANEEAGRKQQQASVAQQLPPVVEIISPSDSTTISSTDVTVRFRIRTPSGEAVTNIKALVDGRPLEGARQLVQEGVGADGTREMRLTVPARDSEVSIIAENRFAPSVPATVKLKWNGAKVSSTKPTLYILAVGVSKYANEKYDLQFADKDARDFVNTMTAQKGLQYKDVVIYHDQALTNESATKEEIEAGLDWIRQRPTSDDVAMVFLSGHGLNDQSNYYFFCPYNIDPASLFRTGVPFSDIKNAVAAIKGKVLFFVDSCHSGNSLGTGWRRDMNFLINELSSASNGVLVLSATTSSELAYEKPNVELGMPGLPEWNNGAFTKAVLEAINGAAESRHTGRITYASLVDYVTDRVAELTNNHQHPALGAQAGQNLSIALKR